DNDHGISLTGGEIKVADVKALGIELKDIDLNYQGPGTWSGKASVVLHFAKTYTITGDFGIKNGDFDHLNGSVDGLNVSIGAGIYLQKIGFGVAENPFRLMGSIGLSAGPQVLGKTALTVTGGITATLADPFVVQIDGDAKVADKYELAQAFLRYSST